MKSIPFIVQNTSFEPQKYKNVADQDLRQILQLISLSLPWRWAQTQITAPDNMRLLETCNAEWNASI